MYLVYNHQMKLGNIKAALKVTNLYLLYNIFEEKLIF
jgi:hypothetical protein